MPDLRNMPKSDLVKMVNDAYDDANNAERDRDIALSAAHRYYTALLAVKSELGVSGPDHPAPVANAVEIIDAALHPALEGGKDA